MIELLGRLSPNVLKIAIMLEEIGLDYALRYVDVLAEEQFDEAFLALSPNNKVPVIVDPDGPGSAPIAVFESGAILQYLAEKTGSDLLPREPRERMAALQWLMIQMASIGPMFGQRGHFARYAPEAERDGYAARRYASEAGRIMRMLDRRLGAFPYLAGPRCTIADIATFPWIRTALNVFPELSAGLERLREYPDLASWYADAMAARPAVTRAIERLEGEWGQRDRETRANATAEGFDRYTGRGDHHRPI